MSLRELALLGGLLILFVNLPYTVYICLYQRAMAQGRAWKVSPMFPLWTLVWPWLTWFTKGPDPMFVAERFSGPWFAGHLIVTLAALALSILTGIVVPYFLYPRRLER